jgi:hypothetical protein
MASTTVRVVGSGYTVLSYNNQPIAYCEGWEDSGHTYPVEVATSRVLSGGTLMITVRELWNQPVWWALAGLAGTWSIVDIFNALAANPNYVSAALIIKPPGTKNQPNRWRGKIYQNVTVVGINDGDTITVGALAVTKGITAVYTNWVPLNANLYPGT